MAKKGLKHINLICGTRFNQVFFLILNRNLIFFPGRMNAAGAKEPFCRKFGLAIACTVEYQNFK